MSSEFSSLENYTSESGKYELLPIRFENLSDDEVVITNLVGEFTHLSRETLYALVNHSLKPTDPHYQHLRSKHFLRQPEKLGEFHQPALICCFFTVRSLLPLLSSIKTIRR